MVLASRLGYSGAHYIIEARMDLIINTDCPSLPLKAKRLTSQGSVPLNLLESLNYSCAYPPLAELLRIAHDLSGRWVVLTPVHWQATSHDVHLQDLNLSEQESRYWFDKLAAHVAIDGMILHFDGPYTWLFSADNKPPLNASPPLQLLQHPLSTQLRSLDESNYWQRFLTECQMLFAASSHNSLVNGVWAFGDGQLREKRGTAYVDQAFMSLAQACFASVELYHPEVRLKNDQTVIIENVQSLSQKHQNSLHLLPTHWYWNNHAYALSGNYLTRLWRSFIHAY
jgi:hypothetical protein